MGIWGIVIAGAFFVGVLSANPVVEAAGGWKAAVIELSGDISDIELFLEDRSDFWEFLEEGGEEFFEFDLQLMFDDIAKNADDVADLQEQITNIGIQEDPVDFGAAATGNSLARSFMTPVATSMCVFTTTSFEADGGACNIIKISGDWVLEARGPSFATDDITECKAKCFTVG